MKPRIEQFFPFLSLSLLLTAFLVIPRADALPAMTGDTYFFVSNETGQRYAVKSNGNGTFAPPALAFTLGTNARGAAALADYDGDGDEDAIACHDDNNFCFLFVQGPTGVFTQSTNIQPSGISLGGIESGMAAEDFDQDGNADVLVGGNANLAAVYFGDGQGHFPSHIDNLTPGIPGATSYREKDGGDLDGNGYPDILIGAVPTGRVYSYLNNGNGTFSGPYDLFDTTGTSNAVFALAAGDFDGDGFLDIIAGGAADGEVALWKGNGTGNSSTSFTLVGPVYDFDTQSAVDSYDFDGDGDQDFVAVKRTTGEIFYFAGNGNGTFQPRVLLGSVPPSAFGMATPPAPPIRSTVSGYVLKDLNGNGVADDGGIGIALVQLSLTGTDYLGHPVSLATTSGPDGSYHFTDVLISNAAGYSLSVTTSPNGLATTTESRTISIRRENTHSIQDFLYLPFSTVQGTVYDDRNGNETKDDVADGWAGVSLTLKGKDFRGTAVNQSLTTPDSSGNFTFGGLLPSDAAGYTLLITTPPPGATATTATTAAISLPAGDTTITRVFGYVGNSLISGTFFSDENGNGLNDDPAGGWAAFSPAQPMTERLTGTDFQGGALDVTTISLADGSYSFPALKLSDAAGYSLTATTTPPAELNHPTTTTTRTVIINQGSSMITQDFGFELICTDADHDGFRTQGGLCGAIDCNDAAAAVHPNAAEICNSIDDNCDGIIDESFPDEDHDGVTTCGGDCNDTNAAIKPGATEVCNTLDDNCNGHIDEGFDVDNDSFTTCGGDCNDTNSAIKPGATEVCNLVDDNCNLQVDEGFDADADGFTTCGGDCNDTVAVSEPASLLIHVTSSASAGPGATMTDAVFVGDSATPFGVGSVTIPLTAAGVPIVDPASSDDVAGIHVVRGKDAANKPFVRIAAYGHNASAARESFTASIEFHGATVSNVQNGPNGDYEGRGNSSCVLGNPGQDEYVIQVNGTTGTLCSTTNTDSDVVTISYALGNTLACNEIVNPAVQCLDSAFVSCGTCIHPGAPDSFTDGVDSNCDGAAECTEKKDWNPALKCEGTVTVTNDVGLDAYIASGGLVDGKYRSLKIDYNVSRSLIAIHSPCKISLLHERSLTGDALCLDGRKGVYSKGANALSGNKIALLSEQRSVRLGTRSIVQATVEMVMEAFRQVRIGAHATLDAGLLRLSSGNSEHAKTTVGTKATVRAQSLFLTSGQKARIAPLALVQVVNNFHMDAPVCSLAASATIAAGSRSGSCFASTSVSQGDRNKDDSDDQQEKKEAEKKDAGEGWKADKQWDEDPD